MNTASRSIGDVRGSRIGIAMMVIGALLAAAGLVQTTTSHGGDQECPEGTELIAKFNYGPGGYVFEKPDGNEGVVTLTDASATGATWESTLAVAAVAAVIVKGGDGSHVVWFDPPQFDGNFSNSALPLVGNGVTPDVSHVQFCGPTTPVNSSSTSPSSTSTSTSSTSTSTSTSSPSTSTSTSTTQPGTTTTTKATTTTTIPRETTTSTNLTTTTVADTTTTTIPETTTTQRVAGTTDVISTTTTSPFITSTTVVTETDGTLPFTGGQSVPLIIVGILLLAAGAALTLSTMGRRRSTRA